jgi:DNA-binding MarR family transcriptional regulator
METFINESSAFDQSQHSKDMVELIQRLFRLKNRFRVVIPENLIAVRQKMQTLETGGKHGDGNGFDVFYRVGHIFTRHPEPLTMGELSHAMDVPLSTATRITDWLVNNTYAQRLPDPKDRRVVRVALTPTGMELYQTIHEFFVARMKGFMRHFTVEERETFLTLLRKVVDALEEGV